MTPALLEDIAKEANLYAIQYPEPTSSSRRHDMQFYDITAEELKVFFACAIMMGVVKKQDLYLYWSSDCLPQTA